jgi:hypothetical protein
VKVIQHARSIVQVIVEDVQGKYVSFWLGMDRRFEGDVEKIRQHIKAVEKTNFTFEQIRESIAHVKSLLH